MATPRQPETRSRVETARALSARLPDLLITARRIAANVMLGLHGRRNPGPGETFWQFRPYVAGEPARQIDWRRSARDDHLFIREHEWEASQTVWLWVDLSPSMDFHSPLSASTKLDRAIVLMLALADMLGRGGERVGMPGLAEARIGRDAAERLAEVLARADLSTDWPDFGRVRRFSEVVVLSDFLTDIEMHKTRLRALAGRGAHGHLLQILDPAEETFPYRGRLEFRNPETGEIALLERAETLRDGYLAKLAEHRAALGALARNVGFTFGVHHTDRSAADGLLSLHAWLAGVPRDGMPAAAGRERPAA